MIQRQFLRNHLASAVAMAISCAMPVSAMQIEEVVVTATKREASTQDIPVTVQALGGEALDELNIGDFSDYLKFLPNVNFGGRGPGQNNIYIRGISTDQVAVMLSSAAGSEPNVALYLDEAPVTAAGRNLDIYVTDMERVEVLPGPQGTLFGASSQAGTVRLISNKPKLDEVEASVSASGSSTYEGSENYSLEAMVNIPVIKDRLAIRLAAYDVRNGGYIDNVASTVSLDQFDNPAFSNGNGPGETGGQFESSEFKSADNSHLVEEDFNDSYYRGVRAGAKLAIDDDWELLVQVTDQELGTDGVFDYDPEVGDLEATRFFEDDLEDEFTHVSLTLEGRLGMLDVIYTGSYLDREVESSIDYAGYANVGSFVPYYICEYPSYSSCEAPIMGFVGESEYEREVHEIRISTDPDATWHFVGGVYYDDSESINRGDWIYQGTVVQGFHPNEPIREASNSNPNVRPAGVAFINDITRTQEQLAFFGEVTYRFNDQWSMTLGARRYDIDMEMVGSSNFINRGPEDLQWGRNYDELLEPENEKDTIFKATVNWAPNGDVLLFATYSEGFRPGGFNRASNEVVPQSFESDTLDNLEFGWKTTLLDGSMQFNGAIYYVEWSNLQTSYFNPQPIEDGGLGTNLTSTFNSGEAEVRGIEGDLIYWPTDKLSINGAFSFNDSELVKKPERSGEFIVEQGSDLAMSPEFQANLRLRYHFALSAMEAYWQLSGQYSSSAYSSIVIGDRYEMDSYATFDGAIGVSTDQWNLEFYAQNLTDERAELFISTMDDIPRTVTNRPRTLGMRVSWTY
ncbi:TonB-dependent receptor [Pseudomaricurvus alkylphenolicus]|uniref:TonB-dependent receptor n=1 Tax=Pseudomaricurvus alkylphenolicus TaxID=1306991 RepID=UPI001421825C|nr:TonB-dependent receptor [Pseudomaricurvus alkylphenolicus]NIB40658.1 TonB-dependent receptor [Pseudomaricurvus alkylphenolicus]